MTLVAVFWILIILVYLISGAIAFLGVAYRTIRIHGSTSDTIQIVIPSIIPIFNTIVAICFFFWSVVDVIGC